MQLRCQQVAVYSETSSREDAGAVSVARKNYRRTELKPGGTKSDHCFLAALVLDYKNSINANKDKLMLSYDSLKEAMKLKTQYLQALSNMGFVDDDVVKRSASQT